MQSLFFGGAAGMVTGSRHLLTMHGKRVLLDCGMVQGDPEVAASLNKGFLFDPRTVDAVLLSHGHLDHCGGLPLLVKQGFTGSIFATDATRDTAELIMLDTARIAQENYAYAVEQDLPFKNPPAYTTDDVAETMRRFVPQRYGHKFSPAEGVLAMFLEAGHIIGSAQILVTDGKETLLFSGDLGREGMPTLRDPAHPGFAQTLLLEATYGDREHRGFAYASERLTELVKEAVRYKSKIVAPAFAVGRTQMLLALLADLHARGEIPEIPVFVDSPLADRVTEVYSRHAEYFDSETRSMLHQHVHPFQFPGLRFITSQPESKALNDTPGPMLIISSSGMGEAGRVKHHLLHTLPQERSVVLITGFMAEGTLGRRLVEGATSVRIFNQVVPVRSRIENLRGLSAHADKEHLVAHAAGLLGLERIVLVHGEERALTELRDTLQEALPAVEVHIPAVGETVQW